MTTVMPTGATHEVGPHQIFFSTTDHRGVIDQANSVFVDLSRYSREELMGAPHNIIRHPDMPGGAFKLMWDTLGAGKPFCAYVDNVAKDGSSYAVFATITPLGEGYLSVRTRPLRTDLQEAARGLYRQTRPLELAHRAEGASAHQAAVYGLDKLAELLGGLNLSYEQFMLAALPAEVAVRDASQGHYPQRPSAQGQLRELLEAGQKLHAALLSWVSRLDDFQQLMDSLTESGAKLAASVTAAEEAGTELNEVLSSQTEFAPMLTMVELWTKMQPEITSASNVTSQSIAEFSLAIAQTRFQIALSALHSETVGQFICELIDEVPGHEQARPVIRELAAALTQGIKQAAATLEQGSELASRTADSVAELAGLLGVPTSLLDAWTTMASTMEHPAVEKLMPRVTQVLNDSQTQVEELAALAERCRQIPHLDSAAVQQDVATVEDLASRSSAQ